MENNNITLFENQYVAEFKKLGELKKQIDELTSIDKNIRAELEKAMNDYDIQSIKNEYVSISRIKESESLSIDLNKLEEKEPNLYKDLLTDYPKITKRKASIRIAVK